MKSFLYVLCKLLLQPVVSEQEKRVAFGVGPPRHGWPLLFAEQIATHEPLRRLSEYGTHGSNCIYYNDDKMFRIFFAGGKRRYGRWHNLDELQPKNYLGTLVKKTTLF